MDTLDPVAKRIFDRVEEELGQTCSDDLRGRSSCLPEVHGADADEHLNLHFVVRDHSTTYSRHNMRCPRVSVELNITSPNAHFWPKYPYPKAW